MRLRRRIGSRLGPGSRRTIGRLLPLGPPILASRLIKLALFSAGRSVELALLLPLLLEECLSALLREPVCSALLEPDLTLGCECQRDVLRGSELLKQRLALLTEGRNRRLLGSDRRRGGPLGVGCGGLRCGCLPQRLFGSRLVHP